MPPSVSMPLVLALGVLSIWAMRVGWQHRTARTAVLVPSLPAVPSDGAPELGEPRTGPLEATYVSTTLSGDWLDRITAQGLGLGGPAVVQVFEAGVRILRSGAADLFVPVGALRATGTTGGMAGKFVGGDGIVVLTWQAPGATGTDGGSAPGAETAGVLLDTGLRTRHKTDNTVLVEAAHALTTTGGRPGPSPWQEEKS